MQVSRTYYVWILVYFQLRFHSVFFGIFWDVFFIFFSFFTKKLSFFWHFFGYCWVDSLQKECHIFHRTSKSYYMVTSSDSFLQRILWKLKGPETSFQATFFIEFYDKKSYLVILHKLAIFHYQAVSASQVIQ